MRRLALLILPAVVALAAAADPAGDEVVHLKLRPQVVARGQTVTLADVIVIQNGDALWRHTLGAQALWSKPPDAAAKIVTHEQLEARLRELGVDPARVMIEGATACRVTLPAPEPKEDTAGSAPRSGPADDARPNRTLAEFVQQRVDEALADLGGTVELEWEQASRELLTLTAPPFDFVLQPQGREKLGLREFRVVIRRDGQNQRTVSLFARVRLSKPVLVARKPLSVGTFVEHDQVDLEPRLFERAEDVGLDRIEAVIGQQVARFVPTDQMLRRGDLKSVELVQRSRPVSIVGAGRNVHVRLTGVALDAGSYGDTVRVRLGDTRKSRTILRGVVTGLGTVRVTEEGA